MFKDAGMCFAFSGSCIGLAVGLIYSPNILTNAAGGLIAFGIYLFGIGIRNSIYQALNGKGDS